MLEPMDNTTATQALERHIRESRYFPTIAEIFDNIAADKRALAEHRLVELEAEYRAEEPPMNAERAKAIAENSRKILKVMKP